MKKVGSARFHSRLWVRGAEGCWPGRPAFLWKCVVLVQLTFDQQVESVGILLQDFNGYVDHLCQRRICVHIPLQVIHHVPRFKQTCKHRSHKRNILMTLMAKPAAKASMHGRATDPVNNPRCLDSVTRAASCSRHSGLSANTERAGERAHSL